MIALDSDDNYNTNAIVVAKSTLVVQFVPLRTSNKDVYGSNLSSLLDFT